MNVTNKFVSVLPEYGMGEIEIEDDFEREGDPDDWVCWYCHGEGWGIVGTDWDCTDGVNGPYDGEAQKCPNCHGSGKADDCTFW